MTQIPDHLGGYISGGDPATQFPDLWRWIHETHEVETVLDIGCGDGTAIDAMRDMGMEVVGVDGVEQNRPDILTHDFTIGPMDEYDSKLLRCSQPDMVWSCEFVEHVEERFVRNFLPAFALGNLLLMTHGEPGQPGHHHVNNQTSSYWVGAMAASGFYLHPELTSRTRELAALNDNPWNHYRRSGLAFRRYS